MRITKRAMDELLTPAKDAFVWDDTLKGFGIKITPTGKKVFVLQARLRGKSIRLTIGSFGQPWTVETARAEALRLLSEMSQGRDPRTAKLPTRAEMTVRQLCDVYFQDACGHKKPSTIMNERGKATRHIIPLLGDQPVASLTRAAIQKFVSDVKAGKTKADVKTGTRGRAIVKGGPGTANRTLGLLSSMLSHAVKLEVRPDNPAIGTKQYKLRKRDRYLRADELGRLGETLTRASEQGTNAHAVSAIKFLLLTGCRKNEALTLEWSWVDLDNGMIALPDSKTGARHLHLGAAATELLKSVPRIHGSPFVFPSALGRGHIVGLAKVWKEIRSAAKLEDVRLHDLRHSFASSAVSSGESLYVVGHLLGHTQAQTTQRYAHLANAPVRQAADRTAGGIADHMKGRQSDASTA